MSIKIKLYIIGLIAFLGLGTIFLVNQIGSGFIHDASEATLNAIEAEAHLLQGRRAEKNFLATRDAKYIAEHASFVMQTGEHLELVAKYDPELASLAMQGKELLGQYAEQFKATVDAIQEQGLTVEDGLRGKLGLAVQSAEEVINAIDDDVLLAGMLWLRSHEKDFIVRSDVQYLQEFDEDFAIMQSKVDAASSMAGQREDMQAILIGYQSAFHAYVDKDIEIQGSINTFLDTVHEIEPINEELIESTKAINESRTALVSQITTGVEVVTAISLIVALFLVIKSILGPLYTLQACSLQVAEGEYEACSLVEFSGELESLRQDIARMVAHLKDTLEEAEQKSIEAEEQADRAQVAMTEANEEKERGARLVDKMVDVAGRTTTISSSLTSAAGELAALADEISRGANMQQERTGEAATAMEEMNATVLEVASSASNAAEGADEAKNKATEGAQIVSQVVHATNEVSERSTEMKTTLSELGEKAESIGSILGVITDIADQTNLLALNAAIEAARAGDAGRGFAVVADEVRKLAEKTMQATKEVGDAISGIQEGTRSNIQAMEGAEGAVAKSTELAHQAGAALEEIVGIVQEASDQVRSIATAAEQQSATSEEINRATDEINTISNETAEGIRQSTEAIQNVASLADELQMLIQELNEAKNG